jgi:hypothetical protein
MCLAKKVTHQCRLTLDRDLGHEAAHIARGSSKRCDQG